MREKNGKGEGKARGKAGEEKLTRRAAIKRIAAMFAGAAAGTMALDQQASDDIHLAYLSKPPYNPYVNAVYVPPHPPYSRYMSYYSSHVYHSIYVPPPYINKQYSR